MRVTKTPAALPDASRTEVERWFRDQGMTPRPWSNGPGYRYDEHEHSYHKVLICAAGSIRFRTSEGDYTLEAGDRLDLPPRTRHSADVGPAGVTCVEGWV